MVSGYLAVGATTLTGFFVTPLLLHHLGADHFGLWALIFAVMGYISLVEAGLYTTVSKRVAESLALEDTGRLQRVLGTALAVYLGLMLAVLALVGAVSPSLDRLFHIGPESLHIAQICLLLLGINRCLAFLFLPQSAVLFGAGRFDLVIGTTTTVNILAAIVNIVLVMRGYGVTALAWTTIAATLTDGLIAFFWMRGHLPGVRIRVGHASSEIARELLKYGSRNTIRSVAGTIAYNSDALIIGMVLPLANVAHYSIAAKLTGLVSVLATKHINTLLPAYSHAEAQQDRGRLFQLFTESVSISTAICLPFVIAVCVFGNRILSAWVGPGHEASYAVCAILLVMTLLAQPGNACTMIMTATEKNLFLVRAYVVAAAINVVISYYLTRQLGIIGPAIGSLVTIACVDCALLPVIACREFGFRYRDYLLYGLVPLLPAAVVGGAVAIGLQRAGLPSSRGITGGMLVAVVGACWAAWLGLGVGAERRRVYARSVRAVFVRE